MEFLTVAERAHAGPTNPRSKARRPSGTPAVERWPEWALVFDTETTTGSEQALLFGSYVVAQRSGDGYEEFERGLFHADDLQERDPAGFEALQAFSAARGDLRFYSRREFVRNVLHRAGLDLDGLIVGFNLPFDLSRLAVKATPARGRYLGGFSFVLDEDNLGERKWIPRVRVKTFDSKRALYEFTTPNKRQRNRGRFLDARTLAFALTDRGLTLDGACELFGVTSGKGQAEQHGVITPDYISYNLQDVTATLHLLNALKQEFDRHPIELLPDKVFSPASISKAYLNAMGISRPLEAHPDFPVERLGQAMSAYYGGRAEARIRKIPAPVVYADFLSMYPTVNALMGNWRFVTTEELEAAEATEEMQALLDRVAPEDLYDPAVWPDLAGFAEIEPRDTLVPVRADYEQAGNGYQIGLNPFTSTKLTSWYALPDLIAHKLLTGTAPRIQSGWKLVAHGTQSGLKPVKLRDQIDIEPRSEDFFRRVIEARKNLGRLDLASEERQRLERFLKVLANSGSYGIYAQMNPEAKPEPQEQPIYAGIGDWTAKAAVEKPGEYFFAPLAALITAGARLMLALLEQAVTELGGTYAMCDTDSMAIVATQRGSLISCPGGPHQMPDGRAAIQALSWDQVHAITQRFERLNPYDRTAIPGSILEIEKENYQDNDPRAPQRQLYAVVISAKRYALHNLDPNGRPVLRKWSEHGLGHLLNPTNPDDPDRDWIRQIWQRIIERSLGLPTTEPGWLDRPALTRRSITRPSIASAFRDHNRGKAYPDQVKPYNFILTAHVDPLDRPADADPMHFQLVAPYEKDPDKWLHVPWIDAHTGQPYRITTTGPTTDTSVRVHSYRDVLQAYENHPESKSAAPDGTQADKNTVGILDRLHVHELQRTHIGKESNRLEDVDARDIHDIEEVLASYGGPGTDAFTVWVRPILETMPAPALAAACQFSKSYAYRQKRGGAKPPKARAVRKRLARAAAMHLGLHPSATASLQSLCREIALLSEA